MTPFRFTFCCFILAAFLFGLWDFLRNVEHNACEMTYMYQYPEYLPVKLNDKVKNKFPKYNLFIYGEGSYARIIESGEKLSGVPVLFIPGNAGSHRQVRSLASVALKKHADAKLPVHFNYFVLDLNEELSALYGGVLQDQTRFAYECIKHIISLYSKQKHSPTSVLVIGHSMGGIIARGLFTLPSFDRSLVHTIVTQATPHKAPVIAIDQHIASFYDKVNGYWKANHNTTLQEVTVFSTGGGVRDILVPTHLTTLDKLVSEDRSVSTSTKSMPLCWASTDHLCHVWCRQLVLATKRALYDCIDKKSKQIASGMPYRVKMFRHHFLGLNTKQSLKKTIKLDNGVDWEIRRRVSWRFRRDTVASTRYSVMELPRNSDYGAVVVANIRNDEWLGFCTMKPNEKTCSSLTNAASTAFHLPPLYSNKRVVHLSGQDLMMQTHLVVIIPKSRERVEVFAELFNETNRNIVYEFSSLATWMRSFNESQPKDGNREIVIRKTAKDAVFYNITLKGLDSVLQAYHAHLVVEKCTDTNTEHFAGSVMRFTVPWAKYVSHAFIRPGESGNISLKLEHGKPYMYTDSPSLQLYLYQPCQYRVIFTHSWQELFGQFVRFYALLLPVFFVILPLMALSWQLKALDDQGFAPSFIFSHGRWAQPWRLVPIALMVRFTLLNPEDNPLYKKMGFLPDDSLLLQERNIWHPALNIFLYLVTYATLGIYGTVMHFIIAIWSRVITAMLRRCGLLITGLDVSRWIHYGILMAAFGASYFCGALGMALIYVAFLIKAISTKMAGYLFEKTYGSVIWTRYNLCETMLIFSLSLNLLSGSSLVFWAQNLKYSWVLVNDPLRFYGFGMAAGAIMFSYHIDYPVRHRKRVFSDVYYAWSWITYFQCLGLILYAIVSVYRIFPIATWGFVAMGVFMGGTSLYYSRTRPNMESQEQPEKKVEKDVNKSSPSASDSESTTRKRRSAKKEQSD